MSTLARKLMAKDASQPSSYSFESYYYIDNNNSGATATQSAADLGTPDSSRVIAVLVGCDIAPANTVTGATIGGVTATLEVLADTDPDYPVFLAWASVPSGSTGDIVITFSGTTDAWCYTHVYALYNVNPTPKESGVKSNTTQFPSITFAEGDIGLFIDYDRGPRAWTNATEDYDDENTSTASRDTAGTVVVSNDGEYQQYAVYAVWEQA